MLMTLTDNKMDYELPDNKGKFVTLYQVKATRDYNGLLDKKRINVKKDELGGWVTKEHFQIYEKDNTLSGLKSNAWIGGNAKVIESLLAGEHFYIDNNALVIDSIVKGKTFILDNAKVRKSEVIDSNILDYAIVKNAVLSHSRALHQVKIKGYSPDFPVYINSGSAISGETKISGRGTIMSGCISGKTIIDVSDTFDIKNTIIINGEIRQLSDFITFLNAIQIKDRAFQPMITLHKSVYGGYVVSSKYLFNYSAKTRVIKSFLEGLQAEDKAFFKMMFDAYLVRHDKLTQQQ